jgi:LCCL domain-containing protein
MTKAILLAAPLALVTGCFLTGSVSTASHASKKGCPETIDQSFTALTGCIVDTDGTSEHIGETFTFNCKPFEVSRFVFVEGSDPFAVKSPVCASAAYVGKLDPTTGGTVKIKILAAQAEYAAGDKQNGIKSQKVSSPRKPYVGYTILE